MEKLAVIIFRNHEGKILLQFRDSHAPTEALSWSFFGGVAEGDETPMDALIREVKEELDLNIAHTDVRLLAERRWISPHSGREKIVYFYEGIAPLGWGFDIREGAGGAFLTKDEIAAVETVSLLAKTFIHDYC